MGRIFNGFFDKLSKATDVILIGFYFLLCSLPIFTIGASSTALYYATHKCIYKGRGYTTEFFKSFKDNFKQSTITWLVYLVVLALLIGDIFITRAAGSESAFIQAAPIFFIIVIAFVILWAVYHFAYIARFTDTIKNSFKLSGAIMFANLGWSLIILGILIVALLLIARFPVLFVFSPGLISVSIHPFLERIFRKYMSPEDAAREEEDYDDL